MAKPRAVDHSDDIARALARRQFLDRIRSSLIGEGEELGSLEADLLNGTPMGAKMQRSTRPQSVRIKKKKVDE